MGTINVAKPTSAVTMCRELSLAADRLQFAGQQSECIATISQIYGLFDDFASGILPDRRSYLLAADTAAWIGDKQRCATLVSDVLARC